MSWVQTFGGLRAEIMAPHPDQIQIEDIAHQLSLICRFNGATREHYSVGQHSLEVSYACEPEQALIGLLHDATEIFIGDIVRPLKIQPDMAPYRALEDVWALAVGMRFGLGRALIELPESVKIADERMLATEHRDLLNEGPGHRGWHLKQPYDFHLVPQTMKVTEKLFLDRFETLYLRLKGV